MLPGGQLKFCLFEPVGIGVVGVERKAGEAGVRLYVTTLLFHESISVCALALARPWLSGCSSPEL